MSRWLRSRGVSPRCLWIMSPACKMFHSTAVRHRRIGLRVPVLGPPVEHPARSAKNTCPRQELNPNDARFVAEPPVVRRRGRNVVRRRRVELRCSPSEGKTRNPPGTAYCPWRESDSRLSDTSRVLCLRATGASWIWPDSNWRICLAKATSSHWTTDPSVEMARIELAFRRCERRVFPLDDIPMRTPGIGPGPPTSQIGARPSSYARFSGATRDRTEVSRMPSWRPPAGR